MDYKYTKEGGIEVIGDNLLKAKLTKLSTLGARTRDLKSSFNRAAKPLTSKARANAKAIQRTPRRGRRKELGAILWKSIKFIPSRKYKSLFYVGPARGKRQRYDAWYAYFLEKGTPARHTTKGYYRGRIKAYRYMERAYLSTRGRVRLNIIRELNILIKKLAA